VRVFDFNAAIVRTPGRSVVAGLRDGDGDAPSYDGVAAEHAAYVAALRGAGLQVEVLPPLEAYPDAIFVEDPALVFSQSAILLRLSAPSRAGEGAHLAPVLRRRFERVETLSEGFADGGDVLVTPGRVYIGLSRRTDAAGAGALRAVLAHLGYAASVVSPPPGALHLKTACSLIDEDTVLATPALAASGLFEGLRTLLVPTGEAGAANALRLNDTVLVGGQYPRTIDLLTDHGLAVTPLAVSQVARIDAGLSCMSLRWRVG
jgi:dimethylargininase